MLGGRQCCDLLPPPHSPISGHVWAQLDPIRASTGRLEAPLLRQHRASTRQGDGPAWGTEYHMHHPACRASRCRACGQSPATHLCGANAHTDESQARHPPGTWCLPGRASTQQPQTHTFFREALSVLCAEVAWRCSRISTCRCGQTQA